MREYRYALSLTSQFFFCSLPLRLDTYSRCQFNCTYCFANARGGSRGNRNITSANAQQIARRLEASYSSTRQSIISELIRAGQPIHYGGMSDPFMPLEVTHGQTLEILRILSNFRHPTVLSTKGTLLVRPEYLQQIKRGKFIVQISLTTLDDKLSSKIEIGTPGPTKLIEMASLLIREGVPVSFRLQPLLPNRINDAIEVIEIAKAIGPRHIAVEHLKLPIEKSWAGTTKLSEALGYDLQQAYANWGAKRIGRDWILPVERRLPVIMELRNHAHAVGLSFGAADTDLLLLSDGRSCCSGIDLIDPKINYFKCTYVEAARTGVGRKYITINSLSSLWRPQSSAAMYMNSHSRRAVQSLGTRIDAYLRANWNGRSNGNS